MFRNPSVTALWLILAASPALGQEQKITAADLPVAVKRTADRQSKGATVVGYARETEHGRVVYEVELTVAGKSRDVTIGADGSVLEVEQQVDFDALPPAVRTALTKKAGTGKIVWVESLTKRGALVAYEAGVLTDGRRSEVQVGPNGSALAHEE